MDIEDAGVSLPADAVSVDLVEVRADLLYPRRGVGVLVVRELEFLHPVTTLYTFSEGADEFWRSTGWPLSPSGGTTTTSAPAVWGTDSVKGVELEECPALTALLIPAAAKLFSYALRSLMHSLKIRGGRSQALFAAGSTFRTVIGAARNCIAVLWKMVGLVDRDAALVLCRVSGMGEPVSLSAASLL